MSTNEFNFVIAVVLFSRLSETNTGFARSATYVYLDNGTAVSGSETENGVTTQLTVDSNGMWVREAATINLANTTEVTGTAALSEVPPQFIQTVNSVDKAFYILSRDDTSFGGGKEYTYFASDGKELGKAFEFTNYFGEKVIDFQDSNYHFLGSVRTQADVSKEVRFEVQETSDGTYGTSGDTIVKETGYEYNWNNGTSSWDTAREWTFYFDNSQGMMRMLGGTEEMDGQKITFGEDWVITNSQFTGDVSALQPIQIELIVQSLPEHWTSLGSVKVAEEMRSDANWDLSMKMTAYVNGAEIGTIDVVADFTNGNPQTGDLVSGQMTIYDTDKVTVIGMADFFSNEYGSIGTNFYRSPTSNDGSYKEVNRYEARDANGVITQQDITVSNYTAADVYTGGSFTSNGQTEYYGSDGFTVIDTNSAPVVNAPSGQIAGVVVEDDNSAGTVTGTMSISDADGDMVSASLMNLTGNTQVLEGEYGKLTFTANNLGYKYEIDNSANEFNGLNNGDVEYDSFFVEIKDLKNGGPDFYHTTYKELKFKVEGADDISSPPTGGGGGGTGGGGTGGGGTGGGGTGTAFSLLTGTDKMSLFAGNWSQTADLAVSSQGSGQNVYNVITASQVQIDSKVVEDTINNIGSNGNFGISVTLDQQAQMQPTSGMLELIIRDNNGTGDAYATDGNGGAEIEAKQGDAVVTYKRSDDSSGQVTLYNGASDIFSIQGTTINSPSSLNVKLDKLLSDLGSLTNVNMLSANGNYTYEIRGLQNFLTEEDQYNGNDMPISDFRGSIQVSGSGSGSGSGGGSGNFVPFSLDLGGSNDLTISSGNWTQVVDLGFQTTGSTSGTLSATTVQVDAQTVRDNINGMGTQSNFGISATLDQMANGTSNGTIEIVIRDVKDSNPFATGTGEREISATFGVKVEGTGNSTTITANSGTSTVSFVKSNGDTGTLTPDLTNSVPDVFSITGNNISSPSSLNVKLDKLLDDLGGITNVDMLSSAGRYAYEIKGLQSFLSEQSGSNHYDIQSITGEIDVTGSSGGVQNNVDIKNVEISFNSPSNGGARQEYELITTHANDGNGDDFVDIGLNTSAGHQIKAADVNQLTNPGVSFVPNIEIELGNALDTGGQKLNKKVSIEILEINTGGSNQDYNHDAGERKLELVFDLERSGDGTSETWNSKSNTDMTVNIWDTNDNPNTWNIVYTQ